MGKIRVLPPEEIKKIAAGEVVERPANVVKELVENSLDAGATKIDIMIEDAGKKLVRVIDNGCGMVDEDAYACFEQHATSKISCVNDLATVETFGFRGEALSSIAAVSHVVLVTKSTESDSGLKITLDYGVKLSSELCSAAQGTDVSITEIFSNVPARKKFLKASATELNQVIQFFQAVCFSHPEVHFSLNHDGKMLHNCPAVDSIDKRFIQLWEHQASTKILELAEYKNSDLCLHGFISNHQYARYGRNQIFLFVNHRWVKNPKLVSALLRGYAGVLPQGKYPAAVIFVDVDTTQVDINIHPRKEEVQFVHSKPIEEKITILVKTCLEKNVSQQLQRPVQFIPAARSFDHLRFDEFRPEMNMNNYVSSCQHEPPSEAMSSSEYSDDLIWEEVSAKESCPVARDEWNAPDIAQEKLRMSPQDIAQMFQSSVQHVQQAFAVKDVHAIGQLFKTYILLERDDNFVLLDQHAAHERILYELFSRRFDDVVTVDLLFPITVQLSVRGVQILEPYFELLKSLGIATEVFGQSQIVISATPVTAKDINFQEFFEWIVALIEENDGASRAALEKNLTEKIHAQMACKAAIKAGDILDQQQINQLLADLEKVENRLTCPHGRPTMWLLSRNEIEVKFKRKK